MRTTLELLRLLVIKCGSAFLNKKDYSLCNLTSEMFDAGIITNNEANLVSMYLDANRPLTYDIYKPYFFDRRDRLSRLLWLEQQIEKLELLNNKGTSMQKPTPPFFVKTTKSIQTTADCIKQESIALIIKENSNAFRAISIQDNMIVISTPLDSNDVRGLNYGKNLSREGCEAMVSTFKDLLDKALAEVVDDRKIMKDIVAAIRNKELSDEDAAKELEKLIKNLNC